MQTTAEPPARLHNSSILHKDQVASHEATPNRSQNTTYNFHVCGKKQYSINVSQQLTLSLCVYLDFSIYWRSTIHCFCVSSVVKSQRRCTWCLSAWYHCCPHEPLSVWAPVCVLCVLRFSVVFTCNTGLFQPPAGVWMDWQTEWYYVVRLQVTMRSVFAFNCATSWLQCAKEQVDSQLEVVSVLPRRAEPQKHTSYLPYNWPAHNGTDGVIHFIKSTVGVKITLTLESFAFECWEFSHSAVVNWYSGITHKTNAKQPNLSNLDKDACCHIRQNSVLFFYSLENGCCVLDLQVVIITTELILQIFVDMLYIPYTICWQKTVTEKLSPNRKSAFTGLSSLTGV